MKKTILSIMVLFIVAIYGCAQVSEAPVELTPDTMHGEKEAVEEGHNSETERTIQIISVEELSKHDNEEDCWIIYDGYVFDFSESQMHPNMAKTFWRYCGQEDGFEEGAKTQHPGSNVERVENFGKFLGELG